MKRVVLRKSTTSTDVKYHTVTVPKDSFHPDTTVTVLVEGQRNHVYVDSYLRLKLGAKIFDKLKIDNVGDVLVLEEVGLNAFRATKEVRPSGSNPLRIRTQNSSAFSGVT